MELLYAIPLGISLSFAAGPIFFVLIETSISQGKAKAFSLDLGAVAADLIFIALAYYGSQAFLTNLKSNPWVGLGSGLAVISFGLYYIFKSRKSGQLSQKVELKRKRFFFVKGFLLNFLNLGVLIFWLATTVSVNNLVDGDQNKLLLFYAATLGSYLGFDFIKIYFAQRFKKSLAGRKLQLIEIIIGTVLILFGLFIAVRQWLNLNHFLYAS